MNKHFFFLKYGVNHVKIRTLFIKFGISLKTLSFNNKNLENLLNKFLDLYLIKKEILLKKNHLIFIKQLEAGLFNGYKRYRGLPSRGQRTKTNAKTNRIKNKK